jgi:energy-coupling factor transporter ATP-binding protein EcfA2
MLCGQLLMCFCSVSEVQLDDMPYAVGAKYDPYKQCLGGTRQQIIEEITEWANSVDDPHRILLLTGVAGSGKSTIAHTVARLFDHLKRLGASFCFDRAQQAGRRLDWVFTTVARDLADFDQKLKCSLRNEVQRRGLRKSTHLQEQFESFILKPVRKMQDTIGPILIVIDALDESGDRESRRVFLKILMSQLPELPSNYRILLTTRPEKDILDTFEGQSSVLCKHMEDIDLESTNQDISVFIEQELAGVIDLKWCKQLTAKAEGLFQWAFTACLFIQGDGEEGLDPMEQLKPLLSSTPQSSKLERLDQLYSDVLNQTFKKEDATRMKRFKWIMGRVMAARQPLSIATLNAMGTEDDLQDIGLIIRPLGSLLHGVTQHDVPVHSLHTSFRDFLVDGNRSGKFHVELPLGHQSLAIACLETMKNGLQFNICNLETSYLYNKDMPELAKCTIPTHLSYSCQFWADHLQNTSTHSKVIQEVNEFMNNRLLYWLEVLSLIGKVAMASPALAAVAEWSQVS